MKKLNIAYFGTPSFSALFLEKLLTDIAINQLINIKFVVTQPDRPVGRKQIFTPTPVKLIAQKNNILVSDNFSTFNVQRSTFKDIDLALVFAFGQIIPKELLNLPKFGFINIHPSLLPKYRGPSPIAYPLINGDTITGVTLIQMDEEIDHGPIIAQEKLEIISTDKRPDLEIKLTNLAFKMFTKLLTNAIKTKVKKPVLRQAPGGPPSRSVGVRRSKNTGSSLQQFPPIEQDHKLATYTKLLKKSDGFIPFDILKKALNNNEIIGQWNNKKIYNLFRGLYPWPGIWTILPNGKRLKITNLTIDQFSNLTIKSVQLEGKKEVDFATFNRAYKIFKILDPSRFYKKFHLEHSRVK